MKIDRKEFLEEMMFREQVRKAIRIVKKKRTLQEQKSREEEQNLRVYLQKIINEKKETNSAEILKYFLNEQEEAEPEESPHSSTAINKLETLLKLIIEKIETGYKALTSDVKQRESFREHVINGIIKALNIIDTRETKAEPVETSPEEGIQEDVDVEVSDKPEDDPAFIPVRDVDMPEPEEEKEEEDRSIPGMDETGRDFGLEVLDEIDSQIISIYEKLRNPDDQQLFKNYLITNLKLYFDKFESELKTSLPEPTTPEYEEAKGELETAYQAEEEPIPGTLEEVSLNSNELVEWLFNQK